MARPPTWRVFGTTLDYKTDTPSRTKPDADKDSQTLRADHELLWSKKLPLSEKIFAPKVTTRRREYLIFTDAIIRGIATAAMQSQAPTRIG